MKMLARLSIASLAFAAAGLVAVGAHAEVRIVATSPIKLAPSASSYSAGQCIGGVRRLVPTSLAPGEVLWPMGEPRDVVLTRIALFDPLDPDKHVRGAGDGIKLLLFDGEPSRAYTDSDDCHLAAADVLKLVAVLSIDSGHCFEVQGSHNPYCTVDPAGGALPVNPINLFALPMAVGAPSYGPEATFYVSFEGALR